MRAGPLVGVLVLAGPALAQSTEDYEPIPYEDEAPAPRRPERSQRPRERLREEDDEDRQREESPLINLDDPNTGLSFEVLTGVMLFEAARGSLVDPRFMVGGRFTWEWGRLIPDPFLREMFFADLTWQYAATYDGTATVNTGTFVHGFTAAPAVALPLGAGSAFAVFAQVGAGVSYTYSVLTIDQAQTTIGGVKPLFQYGAGLRARPALTADGKLRLSFRVEVSRYVRGYMHDTFLGGSIGLTF